MEIPLTALSTLTGLVVFALAYIFTRQRLRQNTAPTTRPVHLLSKFFLHMAVFFAFMSAPYAWLYFNAAEFPVMMAWGYTVGHIFLYTAFSYVAAMFCVIVPRFASKEKLVWFMSGVVFNIIITILTALTMVWGTQPVYDYERHITQFNAAPIVGISIGIFALITMMPIAILFMKQAFRSHGGQRLKPLLLGLGFISMTISGPLHDTAQNWQTFLIADICTIISILLLGIGIVYRLNQNFAARTT